MLNDTQNEILTIHVLGEIVLLNRISIHHGARRQEYVRLKHYRDDGGVCLRKQCSKRARKR